MGNHMTKRRNMQIPEEMDKELEERRKNISKKIGIKLTRVQTIGYLLNKDNDGVIRFIADNSKFLGSTPAIV